MQTNMRHLDQTDRKILDILQFDGRISMTELAPRIGLSVSSCTERVRRLERENIISGYHARVAPEALGKTLLVFVELKLVTKSGEIFDKVRQELSSVPEVQECYLVSGSYDYLVKARLGGMPEYRRLLGDILKKLPVAAESHSYVVMEEVKDTHVVQVSL